LRALFFWLTHRAGWTKARADHPTSEHAKPGHCTPEHVFIPTPAHPDEPAPVGASGRAPAAQPTGSAPGPTGDAEPPRAPESVCGDGHGDSSGDGIAVPPTPSTNPATVVGPQHAAPTQTNAAPSARRTMSPRQHATPSLQHATST
jgi:hypothetical protein